MKRKKSFSELLFDATNILITTIAAIISLYPFLYVVFASFSNPTRLVEHSGVLLRPAGFSLDGYKAVLENKEIYIGYMNTIFYVVVGTTLSVIVTAIFAYPLSHPRVKYKGFLNKFIVVTLFFSGGMIPSYMIVKSLGMLDTRWSVIVPNLLATYNVLIMKTAYTSVPTSLEESARLDGANEFQSFWHVILPNVKATLAIMVLYYGVAMWNSWFGAMIYIKDRSLFPLQLFLREILIKSSTQEMNQVIKSNSFLEEVVKHATTVVATVPILLIYPFIQKYFVHGVMIGAVKE